MISHWIVPHGGWKFVDEKREIRGSSFNELVINVMEHRRNNGKEIGNVVKEVEDQIESLNPQLVINKKS